MQQMLIGYLRVRWASGFISAVQRFSAALVLALILPLSVCAYTVVMRSGRRVWIPETFSATRTTLTYEHAPGIYITLQVVGIDFAATDRANQEPVGSFLKRLEQQVSAQKVTSADAVQENRPLRSITDQDLEASRRARHKSEEAYERRRAELGLPSREELLHQREEEARRARDELRRSVEEEAQSEAYWRSRASALRAEIAALDGEINYLRARLAEIPDSFSSGSYTVLTSVVPVLPFNHGGLRHPVIGQAGHLGIGVGTGGGQVFINPHGNAVTPFGHQLAATAFGFRRHLIAPAFPLTVLGASFPYQYPSYERAALVMRLDELGARRAGLQARWRVLEDEARRAGAFPGWLRP